jgi:hypothetical protein
MTNGTGGGFPSDGDEPDEAEPRVRGNAAEQDDELDPETDGIEIVDDGADWLADQLAALPQDTTDIPIVTGAEPAGDDASSNADDADDDGDGDDAPVGRTEDDAPAATRRLPRMTEETPPTPVSARSAAPESAAPEPAAPERTAPEPIITRPRAPEPVAGWFAPSSPPPPRPPLPEPVAPASADSDPEAEAEAKAEPQPEQPASETPSEIESEPQPEVGDESPQPAGTSETQRPAVAASDDRVDDLDDADDEEFDAGTSAPPPISSRAHPNAIALPGLPKRAAADEVLSASDGVSSTDESGTDASVASGTDDSPAGAPDASSDDSAAPRHSAVSRPGIPDDSGEIDFGNFAWSLVANDEDDPHLVRERREAEERAAVERAAAEERATTDRAAADERETREREEQESDTDDASAADRAAAAAAGVTALGAASVAGAAAVGPRGDGEPSGRPDDGDDGATSPDHTPQDTAHPDDVPSWSRPDLDDAFPATAAMNALPADEDPDDPDDELDTAGRFSALGTAAMPVSAASAAVGEAEHAPTPSAAAAARPGNADTVFPDGLVAESAAGGPRRGAAREGGDTTPPRGPRSGVGRANGSRGNRNVPLIAAGVVIVLALVGLFYLGTRLPLIFAGSPDAAASATPTPTPTPTATAEQPASGPLTPGTYAWDELQGGECLDPYSSPWDEEFTVVDCAQPHAGQLVFVAPYSDDPAAPFPGEDVIAAEIGLLCSEPGVIDFGAAAPFTDLQVQGAYPVSGEQWAAGDRDYFCFASRSSGDPLTTSVATAP